MKRAIGILIIVMTFTLTTARPQETTTEDSDSLLKENAQSNADGEHPLFSGYEEGFPNYQQGTEFAGGAEGTVYGGHGPEAGGVTGDIFNPGWTNGGGLSQNFLQQSQGPFHLLQSPTHQNHQAAPLFPNYEISPSPFSPQEGFPFYPEEESPTFPATHETSPLFENATPLVAPILEGNQTLQENNQTRPDSLIGSLWQLLNNSQNGNATAGGAGSGTVQNGSAIGEGTGVANVGFGGFGIGLGIGGAIQTPLGNLAFGQGNGVAIGR
uniref:Uncharacterized protein n=1 Tax=Daphnia galeata TaxID=27404 RepID=A0A8J2WM32_9CRUS|nr:unnamed protein product [Daphnia galeata]